MAINNSLNTGGGVAGQVLTSNGPATAPSFQDAAGGGVAYPQPGIDQTGAIYHLGWPRLLSTSSSAIVDDQLILSPCAFYRDCTVTNLAVKVDTANGGFLYLGLYQFDEVNCQFTLVKSTDSISCATSGVKTAALNQAVTASTPYWLALLGDRQGNVITVLKNQYPCYAWMTTAFAVIQYVYKTVDADLGLPASATYASVTVGSSGSDPLIAFTAT